MQHIEQAISALPNLTPDQRAMLRQMVGLTIMDKSSVLSKEPPGWIDPHDYAVIRRLAITEAYKRRVADQFWIAGKDKAFHESQGVVKSNSVIMPHKFL